jgi:hypothetical protein
MGHNLIICDVSAIVNFCGLLLIFAPINSSNIEIKQKYPIYSKKCFNSGSGGNSASERWN